MAEGAAPHLGRAAGSLDWCGPGGRARVSSQEGSLCSQASGCTWKQLAAAEAGLALLAQLHFRPADVSGGGHGPPH